MIQLLPVKILGMSAAVIYAICMFALCMYGLHILFLVYRYQRFKRQAKTDEENELHQPLPCDQELPSVLVQIPVFNERDVVCRVMDAAASLEWLREKLFIQVLDDSTDDCLERSTAHAADLQERSIHINVIHRENRPGFKAGALEHGMALQDSEFIAIFDADFVPAPDFLQRAIKPFYNNPQLALVQGRWQHLNRNETILTKVQAIGIDGHFAIEQGARAWSGLAMNFNGTCGLWKRKAIEDAGGWQHDTLTEDLDLSYRVQMKGWQCTFRSDLGVPGEIPSDIGGWFSQQFRWAKGSIQTAKKLMPDVWTSSWSFFKKLSATLHLTHYFVHPLILLSLLSAPLALWLYPKIPTPLLGVGLVAFIIGIGAPLILYFASQLVLFPMKTALKHMLYFPALASLGTGIAISNTRAVFEAIIGRRSPFVRTPKKGKTQGSYISPLHMSISEGLCALWAGFGIGIGISGSHKWITPLLFIYVSGFTWIFILKLKFLFQHSIK